MKLSIGYLSLTDYLKQNSLESLDMTVSKLDTRGKGRAPNFLFR